MSNNHRKTYIVEQDLQFRLTFKLCLFSGILFLFFGGLLLLFHKMNYEMLINEAMLTMPHMRESLENEFKTLSYAFTASLVVMEFILFSVGILASHKIVGPIYALKRELKKHIQGERNVRLHLREKDEFHQLKNLFNLAMEKSDQQYSYLRDSFDTIEEALKKDNIKAVKEELDKIKTNLKL